MPSVACLRALPPLARLPALLARPLCLSRPSLAHLLIALSTDPSTDRPRSRTTRPSRPRPRISLQSSPSPRSRPKRRLSAPLAALSAVALARRVAGCAAAAPGANIGCRLLSGADQRPREGAGPASQPPQRGQKAGGWLAGLKGTLGTLRLMGPFAPRNLLLYARAHVVEYTVLLCMVLPNHIFDQAGSLVSANHH